MAWHVSRCKKSKGTSYLYKSYKTEREVLRDWYFKGVAGVSCQGAVDLQSYLHVVVYLQPTVSTTTNHYHYCGHGRVFVSMEL